MEQNSIRSLKGIGEKSAEKFRTLGIETVRDLLYYFPRTYEQLPESRSPEEAVCGIANAIILRVPKAPVLNMSSKTKTAILSVPAGEPGRGKSLRLLWFHMPYIRSVVKKGNTYVFYGTVKEDGNVLVMEQPQIFTPEEYQKISGRMQPVYALTKGISRQMMRKTVRQALSLLQESADFLPAYIKDRYSLCDLSDALRNIHFPADEDALMEAADRLIFDEFFLFILHMRLNSNRTERIRNAFSYPEESLSERLSAHLPYALTGAQQRVLEEIRQDLHSPYRMQRLLQGDVGSGKTIIAFLAMADTAAAGYQALLMAPTDVLARQHYAKLTAFCEENSLDFPVVLLTGSLKAGKRRAALDLAKSSPHALIVGTHALIQEGALFCEPALAVVDEQHRFGVEQRELLSQKGLYPHILSMSATPIPRTLAMLLYGESSVSVLDEVPAKKLPIKNCVVSTSWRENAYRFIEREVQAGHQAYVVCPLIEESEGLEAENVLDYAAALKKRFGAACKIGILHGRMKPEEKNAVMVAFLRNDMQILVSTTVIEVGIDVPNATVMLIEDANRFGLAQLHQLRGRVGRGGAQGYCIFMHKGKDEDQTRLEVLNRSNDGFEIAREDLKRRGPGDFFGVRQSGGFDFRIADVAADAGWLEIAAEEADNLLREDPQLKDPAHAALKSRLAQDAKEAYMSV